MTWHGGEPDPKADGAASDVLTAYKGAVKASRPEVDCYRAGVAAWRQAHPDQSPAYAAKQAVAVILGYKGKALLRPD